MLRAGAPERIGVGEVMVLYRQEVEGHRVFGALSLSGVKEPVAILTRQSGRIGLFRSDGRTMALRELKRLCHDAPEVWRAVVAFGVEE